MGFASNLQTEIDTHLNVLTIARTGNYDSFSKTGDALDRMLSIYGGSSWHYGSPSGKNPDLHHAPLSRSLGGGSAYVGVICNSGHGFGLSANLRGNFVNMNNAAIWDMTVFMHEVGHNFSSGHTHDGYSPKVDTCGVSCPAALPLPKSSTLMSYCHGCR